MTRSVYYNMVPESSHSELASRDGSERENIIKDNMAEILVIVLGEVENEGKLRVDNQDDIRILLVRYFPGN